MVTTKHCCYGDCNSDTRTLDINSGIFFIGFGNGFPKPNKEPEKCKRWVQMCGRKYFTIQDVKKDTYICSLHFVGGKGPTDEHPDPVKCGTQIVRSRKRPKERFPVKSAKVQKQERIDGAETLISMHNTLIADGDENETMDTEMPSTSNLEKETPNEPSLDCPAIKETLISIGVSCKPSTENKMSQTPQTASSDIVRLRIQNKILKKVKISTESLPKRPALVDATESPSNSNSSSESLLKRPVKDARESLSKSNRIPSFNVESCRHDDKMFKFYTGLTYIQFMCLWKFLGNCTEKVNMWNSKVENRNKTPSKRIGRKRAISPMNQLFMTLVRLRLGLLHQDLAFRFDTNVRQISTIVMTWIQLLYLHFGALRKAMFASRSKVRKHLPKSFKKYKNIRCIIDCTEVHVQSPKNFAARGNQYSSYKGYTSYKFLVAVAPNGAIMFVSDAFEGSISDKENVRQSGFLDFLEPGDVIMADRGFLIDDLLNERHVKMVRPPFLGTRDRFTPQEEAVTKDIAKHRIHVKRSIERMKKYKLLQKIVPQSLQPVFSQMIFVIACLVNFQPPLVK